MKFLFLDPSYARTGFYLIDRSAEIVFSGKTSKPSRWNMSGTAVTVADFSDFREEGKFYLLVDNDTLGEVLVSKEAYLKVGSAMVNGLYFARASMQLTEEYAGQWARPEGHPDTKVYVHRSAASPERPEGTVISSPGGWYDAGDYNKYIVNSSISVFTLLNLYEMFPEYISGVKLNIPEKGNRTPDVLDEALYNLRWMLTMQDPFDGGVYHKLTNKSFGGMVMPHNHKADRFVVMKTTAASLDFAATMAKASRVIRKADPHLAGLSDSCLIASRLAWEWSLKNPDTYYLQPEDIKTGAYADQEIEDEWLWAATELYLSTGNYDYREKMEIERVNYTLPQWRNVSLLPLMSIVNSDLEESNPLKVSAGTILVDYGDRLLGIYNRSVYRIPMDTFEWGSNGDLANNGIVLLHAYKQTGRRKYLEAADAATGYLLGANPLCYSFVTGFGWRYPVNIHDRRISADGIVEPIPGLLAGGPTPNVQSDCGEDLYSTKFPAMSYVDQECSYSTNEVAINWNTAAAGLFLGLDAVYSLEVVR